MFIVDSLGLTSVNLMQLAPRVLVLREITHIDGHCAVQGHLRSSILVPIESSYATSYKCNLCHISHRFRIIVAHWFKLSFLTGECFLFRCLVKLFFFFIVIIIFVVTFMVNKDEYIYLRRSR